MLIERNNNCTTRYLYNDRALIVNYEKSKLYELNNVALFIWNLIQQPLDLHEVAFAISNEYAIGYDEAYSDSESFITYLVSSGLVNTSSKTAIHRSISKDLRNELKVFGKNNQIPIRAIIELTDACNLNCIHCYRVVNGVNKLQLSEIKTIIDDLSKLGCVELTLTGGEIFTRQDIYEIIDYADKQGFSIVLLSNGTIINQEGIDKLSKIEGVGCIQLSLYSDSMKVHDSITQQDGSFLSTIKTAVELKKKGLRVRLACPVMKPNFKSYLGIKEIAKTLDCEYEFNYPITSKEDGDKSPHRFRLSDSELMQLFAENEDFFCGEYDHKEQ